MPFPHFPAAMLGRCIQAGENGMRPVRLVSRQDGNRWNAHPIENNDDSLEINETIDMVVVNLGEPPDGGYEDYSGSDVLAFDVEGLWLTAVARGGSAMFPARVIASLGGAEYTVREQAVSAAGTWLDTTGAIDLTATNLAEISVGLGSAVDTDTMVLVTSITDTGTPPSLRYVFHHTPFAKYLD